MNRIWLGKKTERVQIKVTQSEKADLKKVCQERGVSITEYLMDLHHSAMGRYAE